MNMKHSFLAVAGAATLLLAMGCQGGGGGGQKATVDGDAITTEEFMSYLESKPTVRVNVQGQVVEVPVADTLGFQALQDLVGKKVMMSLAKEAGVAPSDKDIEEEIKFRQEISPNFVQNLQKQGFTTAQIRREVMYSLAQERLLTKGITIPMAEVEKFIKDNPQQFIEPASAVIDIIFVPDADKAKADAEFAKGSAFDAVKLRYDKTEPELRSLVDATMANGQGVPLSDMKPEFSSAIEKTAAGQMTGWVKSEKGSTRFKVISKKAKKNMEMTKERKEYLQRQMAMQRGSAASDLQDKIANKLKAANIDVKDEAMKEIWKNFMDRIKSQGGSAATPPAK